MQTPSEPTLNLPVLFKNDPFKQSRVVTVQALGSPHTKFGHKAVELHRLSVDFSFPFFSRDLKPGNCPSLSQAHLIKSPAAELLWTVKPRIIHTSQGVVGVRGR